MSEEWGWGRKRFENNGWHEFMRFVVQIIYERERERVMTCVADRRHTVNRWNAHGSNIQGISSTPYCLGKGKREKYFIGLG